MITFTRTPEPEAETDLIVFDQSTEYLKKYLSIKNTDTILGHLDVVAYKTNDCLLFIDGSGMDLQSDFISSRTEQMLFLQEIQRNENHKKHLIEKFLNAQKGIMPEVKTHRFFEKLQKGPGCSCYSMMRPPEPGEFWAVRDKVLGIDIVCKICRRAIPGEHFIDCLESITNNARDEYENLFKYLRTAMEKAEGKKYRPGEDPDSNPGAGGETEDPGADAQIDA